MLDIILSTGKEEKVKKYLKGMRWPKLNHREIFKAFF